MTRLLFGATIFTSAFLLFLVQPLVSKHILPWFGGSSAVWATCMVFFQVVLLAGYAYADALSRQLTPRRQAAVHVGLLALSAVTLTVLADVSWKPSGNEDPVLRILGLLGATIGLPYFLLSTTGPLLQSWVARTGAAAQVYRYFSLSNGASLLALIAYPFAIEPYSALAAQARGWSAVYALFALCCAASAVYFARHAAAATPAAAAPADTAQSPTRGEMLLWLGLAAMGSWLLLAVTNHITQNIAAIPFLWLLPLTIYLLTFVLAFESDRWYRRKIFLPLAALLLIAGAWGLESGFGSNVKIAVLLYGGGLFFYCMALHGELARQRPPTRYLTRFYLMVSCGGAIGGIVVGLLAPRLLPAYYELGAGYVLTALLGCALFRRHRRAVAAAAGVALVCAVLLWQQVAYDLAGTRTIGRNFYGTVLTADVQRETAHNSVRRLFHGAIIHGEQYLAADRRMEPTTYYGPTAGIGLALAQTPKQARRIGLIGMGAGTLALYGRAGDLLRFYEIDPQVIELAGREFSFTRDSPARVETVLGDARLSLERETPQRFDVLAVDAFSGDAVPVHLLTREAMAVYLRHLAPGGIVAFHVTNRFLALAPVVERIAAAHGLASTLIHDDAADLPWRATDWLLVAREPGVLAQPSLRAASRPIAPIAGLGTWSDDYNNLFQVLK